MANIVASCVPRILDLLWMQKVNMHRAYALFNCEVTNADQIKPRTCDIGVWDHIRDYGIHDSVFENIQNAGFGGLIETGYHKFDHACVNALVESWRPETHTFHLPIREATVTLEDVAVLYGMPIDGPAVSGTWHSLHNEQWVVMCENVLGFIPGPNDIKQGSIKILTMVEHLDDPLVNTDDGYEQRARIYILAMIGGHLFSDLSSLEVSLNYLQNIVDLSVAGRKSWGSAVFSHLYRNLCDAAERKENFWPE